MEITPHISEGDMLRLEITLNRSAFIGLGVNPERPPDKTDEDVTTVVTVPDRSTIILGGLEGVENNKGGKKIPILGDLPLIGGLFRKVAKSEKHNKLYIFVKAHILRPGQENTLADLKAVSLKNREAFEKLEREMDGYQDWPGLKPVPMDPPRVLEADSDFPMIPSRDS
jgi:type II secretory pathway component GspD/PulD (secretin)